MFVKRNRKGQVIGRVVIYVLGVIVAAMILVYGVSVIKATSKTMEDITLLTFKQELQKEIEAQMGRYKAQQIRNFHLPTEFSKVCFMDGSVDLQARLSNAANYTLIKNSVGDRVKSNFFLIWGDIMRDAFYVGNLYVKNGFDCINVDNGQLVMQFDAHGRSGVELSQGK